MKRTRQRRLERLENERLKREEARDKLIGYLTEEIRELQEQVDQPSPPITVEPPEVHVTTQEVMPDPEVNRRLNELQNTLESLQEIVGQIEVNPEVTVQAPEVHIPDIEPEVVVNVEQPMPKSYKVIRNDMGFVERVEPEF